MRTVVHFQCRVCNWVGTLDVSVYAWQGMVKENALPFHCKEEMMWCYE